MLKQLLFCHVIIFVNIYLLVCIYNVMKMDENVYTGRAAVRHYPLEHIISFVG